MSSERIERFYFENDELVATADGPFVRYSDHERTVKELEARLFKNACRIYTEWIIDRYLMSNAVNRVDPAEKAERHIQLCKFYVAVVRGGSVEDAMGDYTDDFERLHEESQDLTSALDVEIGFPLDQTPNYEELNPKFFERFHAIACRVLNIPNAHPSLSDAIREVEKLRDGCEAMRVQAIADGDPELTVAAYLKRNYFNEAVERLKSLSTQEGKVNG